ncbi:inosine monophosphate dehydrogenase, partial [Lecanosticta acicola]
TKSLPWTRRPLIVNAPMGGIAGADLAVAVTRAGGLGQIGGVPDLDFLSSQLSKAEQALHREEGLLPVGVGILLFAMEPDASISVLSRYRPAVVWLFAAQELTDYAIWADKVREALPESQIWIQVGSVEAALTIASSARPSAMCVQGSDAGGHGFEKGAGIIALLPEVSNALAAAGHADIPLVAAGGITDGRAAAAALILGAQGVVMGTRFLAAPETMIHPMYRSAILNARDGGQSTVRDKLFDEVRGPNQWPREYNGRSIRTDSLRDHEAGLGIEEIRRRFAEASKAPDGGFALPKDGGGRAATWAGTGVGLVKKEQHAAEIVDEVRREVILAFNTASAKL